MDFQEFLNEEAKNIIGDRHKEKEGQKGSLIAQSTKAASSGGDAGTTDDGFLGNMILTKDQIEHAEMKFQDWDTDNSGSLTVDELKKVRAPISPEHPRSEKCMQTLTPMWIRCALADYGRA